MHEHKQPTEPTANDRFYEAAARLAESGDHSAAHDLIQDLIKAPLSPEAEEVLLAATALETADAIERHKIALQQIQANFHDAIIQPLNREAAGAVLKDLHGNLTNVLAGLQPKPETGSEAPEAPQSDSAHPLDKVENRLAGDEAATYAPRLFNKVVALRHQPRSKDWLNDQVSQTLLASHESLLDVTKGTFDDIIYLQNGYLSPDRALMIAKVDLERAMRQSHLGFDQALDWLG